MESERELKAPYVLVACAQPHSEYAPEAELAHLRARGFVAEEVDRSYLIGHLRSLCWAPNADAPDGILLAPEDEHYPMNFRDRVVWNAFDLVERVRALPDSTLLPGGVRAKTIPIILAAYGRNLLFYHPDGRPFPSPRWFRECRRLGTVVNTVEGAIRDWRRDLMEEVAYVGLAITKDSEGEYSVGHAAIRSPRDGRMLAAPASAAGLTQAHWYIFPADVLARDIPGLLELDDLLRTFKERAKLLRKQPETIFQDFFNQPRHAHMLYQGLFTANYPKVPLPVPGRRPLQPDYLQSSRPLSSLGSRGGVLDLKRPDACLLTKGRHSSLGAEIFRAVAQLQDYRDRLDSGDPAVAAAQFQRMGCVLRQPLMSVVIGLRRDYDPDDLRHREETMLEPLEVQLITYDDIIQREAQRIMLQHRLAGGQPS